MRQQHSVSLLSVKPLADEALTKIEDVVFDQRYVWELFAHQLSE